MSCVLPLVCSVMICFLSVSGTVDPQRKCLFEMFACQDLEDFSSDSKDSNGVPQGSVLGLIPFTMYMLHVQNTIQQHGINLHFYANKTQLYL